MRFQERQKTKNHGDKQGNHQKESVRYLGYSRLSGLQPGDVVVVTSSFSDSIVFAIQTRKTAFSNSSIFRPRPSTLHHFQTKTVLFSVIKKICIHTYRFRSFSLVYITMRIRIEKRS